jgi:UDP-N-acetyl-D-mannosaminuronic acid transferase (WecB/TagA/CpsF family)
VRASKPDVSDKDIMPKVLDIPIHGGSLGDAVDRVISLCGSAQHKGNHLVSATSVHGLVFARRRPGFRRVLKGFFLNLPDGKPVAWVGRHLKGAAAMRQCRGKRLLHGRDRPFGG